MCLGKWKYQLGLGTLYDYDLGDGWLWGDSFDNLRTASSVDNNALGCDLDTSHSTPPTAASSTSRTPAR